MSFGLFSYDLEKSTLMSYPSAYKRLITRI